MSSPPSGAASPPLLTVTRNIKLCLAHYCDLHGPTPMMVTEGMPVPCSTCLDPTARFPDDTIHRPGSQPLNPASPQSVAAITDALRRINFASSQQQQHRSASLPASEHDAQTQRAALLRSSTATAALSSGSAIETPPASPRRQDAAKMPPPPPQASQHVRRDSSFRKTYDEIVTKRASRPCDNCAMTLPKRVGDSDEENTSNNTADMNLKTDARAPTLRTKKPYAWVFGPGSGPESPPTSHPSSASDTDGDAEGAEGSSTGGGGVKRLRRTATSSTTSRSSVFSSATSGSHTHFVEYISTKEPMQLNSFAIIRASCLRTLSFETLPRAPSTATSNTSPALGSVHIPPPSLTTHASGTAASGGPIFFGDPQAGYTTAYIFRIPDVHARGHKRVYAFLALTTHKERLAMKTFGFFAAAFHTMAQWIQQLAEAEAERERERAGADAVSPRVGPGPGHFPPSNTTMTGGQEGGYAGGGGGGGTFDRVGGSAFSRRVGMGPGPAAGVALRSRGLAELVGMPEFFLQLHVKFVQLLGEVGVKMNG